MKIATQHYQDSVITPYGNNHWNGKEKIDISKEKDDAVILEISAKGKRAIQLKEKNEFEQNIVQVDKSADDLPAYSGMYDVDKTISSSLENCSKEEQGFVYDIIRENFLIGNGSSVSEEERQANISLGMKKAEYAANNFISEDKKSSFLDAIDVYKRQSQVYRERTGWKRISKDEDLLLQSKCAVSESRDRGGT